MLIGVLGVGVVGVAPLVLPTQVVRVAVVVTDFVILYCVGERLEGSSRCRLHLLQFYQTIISINISMN